MVDLSTTQNIRPLSVKEKYHKLFESNDNENIINKSISPQKNNISHELVNSENTNSNTSKLRSLIKIRANLKFSNNLLNPINKMYVNLGKDFH